MITNYGTAVASASFFYVFNLIDSWGIKSHPIHDSENNTIGVNCDYQSV